VGLSVGLSRIVSAYPSFSLSSPVLMWGPSHWRQFSTNFSDVCPYPSCGLQFFMNCSSMSPFHRLQSFRNRLLQCGSHTRPQILPANLFQHGLLSLHRSTGPARSLLQHGLPIGSQPLLGTSTCSNTESTTSEICSTMDLHMLQGVSLPHHGLHHGLQGNLCSGAWSTSSPSSLTSVSAGLFLSHILTPLSWLQLHSNFSPSYIPCARSTTTVADGLSHGQRWVHLGASWHWLCGTIGGASSSFSQKPPL